VTDRAEVATHVPGRAKGTADSTAIPRETFGTARALIADRMGGFARAWLLALGLVLGGMGCLAGPQPDPPGHNPDVTARDSGRGEPRDAGLYEPPAADAAGPGADSGPADPGARADFAAGAGDFGDDSDGESVAAERRRDVIWRPEDRIQSRIPLDAGLDAGDADQAM
jgi:hypothetical protein